MNYFFYRDIKFYKYDIFTKLPLRGSQNQATYFLKKKLCEIGEDAIWYENPDSHPLFLEFISYN